MRRNRGFEFSQAEVSGNILNTLQFLPTCSKARCMCGTQNLAFTLSTTAAGASVAPGLASASVVAGM